MHWPIPVRQRYEMEDQEPLASKVWRSPAVETTVAAQVLAVPKLADMPIQAETQVAPPSGWPPPGMQG